MAALITKPSLIEAAGMKFLIIDAPREQNLHLYLKEFKKYNVKHLVRIDVTPPGYSGEDVEKAGIVMHVRSLLMYLLGNI
jgi:protein tyrosine phosphatase type 4A